MGNNERKYVFHVSRGPSKHERYEKAEAELSKAEKDLLLGRLIQEWENNTEENRLKFMQIITVFSADKLKEAYTDGFGDTLYDFDVENYK
jgi:hypothetical protein